MLKILMDFDSDLEPSQAGVQTEMQKTYPLPSTDVGWATFDVATQEKATVMPSNSSSNTLGDQLLQLSTSASAPPSGFPTVQNAKSSFPGSNHGGQQHQLSLSSAYNIQSSNPPLNIPNGAPVNDQLWVEALHATVQETSTLPASQGTNIFIGTHESVIGSSLQQPPVEAISNGRKALPEDIYTMSFAPVHTSVWGWQTNACVKMGYIPYGMIYPVGAVNTSQTFAHPNSINPFDAVQESRLAHSSTVCKLSSHVLVTLKAENISPLGHLCKEHCQTWVILHPYHVLQAWDLLDWCGRHHKFHARKLQILVPRSRRVWHHKQYVWLIRDGSTMYGCSKTTTHEPKFFSASWGKSLCLVSHASATSPFVVLSHISMSMAIGAYVN